MVLTPVLPQNENVVRRTTCKFRHITKEEEESEIKDIMHTNARMGLVPPFPLGPPTLSNGNSKLFAAAAAVNSFLGARADSLIDDCSDFGPPLAKRRFMAADLDYMEAEAQKRRAFFKGYFAGNPPMLSGVDARLVGDGALIEVRHEVESVVVSGRSWSRTRIVCCTKKLLSSRNR